MTAPAPFRGVFAPTATPVRADLSPDVARWIDLCKQLLADGCHGLCPFGTTSEANSFSVEERMSLLTQLVESGVDPAVLMPGTGMCAIPDAVRLTRQAVDLGCSGVLMLPPFYYKGVSDEGIYAAIAEVIQQVGDERLRIYLYHIPPIAQVGFSLDLIGRLISDYPDTVVGLKDSSGDWNNLQAILTNFPGFATFSGSERFLLETMRLGGAGTISAMANIVPGVIRRLYDGWTGDDAEALQAEANQMRTALADFPMIPAVKGVIAHQHGDAEWRRVRPPLVALSDAQQAAMAARLGA
ncbi:MAG: dihydrodipicolinate synthase family protein [Caldilineaceae bacterium]|nr:dihydrodipicolinate synthase family protein [Caldilineaceae bacterium]